MNDEQEVIAHNLGTGGAEVTTRAIAEGELDVQIATARAYPRDIRGFVNDLTTLATLDRDVADSCFYTLKRKSKGGGVKLIVGPSIRFAELATGAWNHMRVASRIVAEKVNGNYHPSTKWGSVTVEAVAMDLQNNVAWKSEVKRTIQVNPAADGVAITVQAAQSIASRNAVLKVVPQGLWESIFRKAKQVAAGGDKPMSERRANCIAAMEALKIPLDRALEMVGKPGVDDLDNEALLVLRAACRQIKDGAATVAELFPPTEEEQNKGAKAVVDRLTKKDQPGDDDPPPGEPAPVADPESPSDLDRIMDIIEQRGPEVYEEACKAAGLSTDKQPTEWAPKTLASLLKRMDAGS